MEVVFWICIGSILYVYGGYPLLLLAVASVRQRRTLVDEAHRPSVTIVVSAFNEEAVIAEKLANTISLDYPSVSREIIVVSDGSSDSTDEIVRNYPATGIRLLRMNDRVGKSVGLNAALEAAQGEIVLFTDANAMFERDALSRIVRHFVDPDVGCVTGAQRYFESDAAAGRDEGLYWRYELRIKEMESRTGSLVGGDGATMAIRRRLYEPLEASDLSDFIVPLRIVAAGHRNVFEPSAVCHEHPANSYDKEFARKVRIVNRAWRATIKMRHLLNPLAFGWFSISLFSHKVLRWLLAPFMMGALVANVALASEGVLYAMFLAGQSAVYAAAGAGLLLTRRGIPTHGLVSAAYYLCLVNVASLMGIFESMRGRTYTIWSTAREGNSA